MQAQQFSQLNIKRWIHLIKASKSLTLMQMIWAIDKVPLSMTIMVALNLTHKVVTCKTKKGNFFNQEEKRQLCRSFLVISQDLVGNNDKSQFFCGWIGFYFNLHKRECVKFHLQGRNENGGSSNMMCWSLWGYAHVWWLNVNDNSLDDMFNKVLQCKKWNIPRGHFVFIHCRLLLKYMLFIGLI